MYIVVNISKPPNEVVIGDLNFSIGPNKAIDLEKIVKRSAIEDSDDLKRAVKLRLVEVRHTTRRVENPIEIPIQLPAQLSDADVERIRSIIKEEVQFKQSKNSSDNTPEIMEMLKKMITDTMNASALISKETEIKDKNLDTIDEAKLIEIHAKAVAKKSANADGNINYSEKRITDSISDRASELDNLLG